LVLSIHIAENAMMMIMMTLLLINLNVFDMLWSTSFFSEVYFFVVGCTSWCQLDQNQLMHFITGPQHKTRVHNNWRSPWKNQTSRYISFFHPSLNCVLFPMFCLLVKGECQILVF